MSEDLLRAAAELEARGEAYALATVVWRRAPSSGKVGSKALITADGRIRGWLGGACAEPAVIAESRRAIVEGTPRLMFLGSPEELPEHRREGVVSIPIACQSEGALEVYVEPQMPKQELIVIGRSPAVDTLVAMAGALGWRTAVLDDEGIGPDHPAAGRVLRTLLDLDAGSGSFVVVATQGHYDEDALERALATPAAYVGFVASRRRADAVLGYLRDRGATEEQLARVRAPAGLDLGPVAHEEIAVAILAELVQVRASREGKGEPAPAGPTEGTREAVDPVCGMSVLVATARYRASYDGHTYSFCSAGCRRAFESEPARFVTAEAV